MRRRKTNARRTLVQGAACMLMMLAAAASHAGEQTADECLIKGHGPVKNAKGKFKFYHVSREPITLARTAKGAQGDEDLEPLIEIPQTSPELGTLYRSALETDDAVLLGHYTGLTVKCFTKLHGWASREDLIETSEAVRVGELVRKNPELAEKLRARYPAGKSLIEERSRIHMRVLMRPEQVAQPRLTPDESGDKKEAAAIGDTYFWRYVYDARTDGEGNIWYLIATHRSLIKDTVESTEAHEKRGTSQRRLQGWVHEDTVVPWPTNIVVELNAHEAAVAERFPNLEHETKCDEESQDYTPGMIVRKRGAERAKSTARNEDPGIIAYESCNLWREAFGARDRDARAGKHNSLREDKTIARFLPKGLGNSTVRAHVQEMSGGWARVATLGRLTGNISYAEHSRVRKALLNVVRSLSQIEIVLVVDATGSMHEEIQDVGKGAAGAARENVQEGDRLDRNRTLPDHQRDDRYRADRARARGEGQPGDVLRRQPQGDGEREADEPRDEVGGAPPYGTHLQETSRCEVSSPTSSKGSGTRVTIVKNNTKVSGSDEATLEALAKVIDDDSLWGDPMLGQQVVVLVTDEEATEEGGINRWELATKYQEKTKRIYTRSNERAKEHGYEAIEGEIAGDSRDFLWGSLIYTGSEDWKFDLLKKQLSPLGIFGKEQIHRITEDERRAFVDADYKLAAGAIVAKVNEEQRKIENTVASLEQCAINPSECLNDGEQGESKSAMKQSRSEIERAKHALVVRGLNANDVFQQIKNGLVEGYVQLSTEGRRATWRRSVMLDIDQARQYTRALNAIVLGLKSSNSFDRCDSDEADIMRLVLFLREIAGAQPTSERGANDIATRKRHADIDTACGNADAVLTGGVSGTLLEDLNIPHVLPLNSKGAVRARARQDRGDTRR